MGFYIRKSVSVGPFRFNLSSSGVGVSAGIKGLRVGTGPRGNYVSMGRNGIYFRQTLPPGNGKVPKQITNEQDSGVVFHDIESGDVARMVDSSSVQLLQEINTKARKPLIWPWALGLSFCIIATIAALSAPMWVHLVLIPLFVVAVILAIRGFGIARTHCYTSPRPDEFGHIGEVWDKVGWRVDVDFQQFAAPARPSQHMTAIAPVLPERYSPIRINGHGNQGVYLAAIPRSMALVIAHLGSANLVGLLNNLPPTDAVVSDIPDLIGVREWEAREKKRIVEDPQIEETVKQALIKARRGQGLFRERVKTIERQCRVTGVNRPEHLIASHIKPWRESTNPERLSEANGLLLTPSVDHLFDRGFISFEGTGELLVSPVAHTESLQRMGIPTDRKINVGGFAGPQKEFLSFHRAEVFLKSLS